MNPNIGIIHTTNTKNTINITISGLGYVGCSLAVLLSQDHLNTCVTAVDVLSSKVESINNRISPIRDDEISTFLSTRSLNLKAVCGDEAEEAYRSADIVIIAVPTNYDPAKNFFDTHFIEDVIDSIYPKIELFYTRSFIDRTCFSRTS